MTVDLAAVISRVRAALRRRGRSLQDADDIVQDAWIRLATYASKRPVQRQAALLMRIALNLSIDSHRRELTRGEEVQLEDVLLVDVSPSAEMALLARERLKRLSVCLGRLNRSTREIFLAHRIDGMTYQEIARDRNVSISTVEQHVAKAMMQLTTWMEGW